MQNTFMYSYFMYMFFLGGNVYVFFVNFSLIVGHTCVACKQVQELIIDQHAFHTVTLEARAHTQAGSFYI